MADIEHIQYLKVPAKEVFDALITEKGLSGIWTNDLSVSSEPGAVNTFGFGDEKPTLMKVIELEPNKRLVWECVDSDPEWIGTKIYFNLEEKNGITSLTLRHRHWREVTEFYRFCNYNWAMFLYSLKSYCEKGEGMPYQSRVF